MTLHYISHVNALSTGQIRAGTGFYLSSFALSGIVAGTLPHPCRECGQNKQKTKQKLEFGSSSYFNTTISRKQQILI
jgi:hypothetical protein